jgi:HSP20 family protein
MAAPVRRRGRPDPDWPALSRPSWFDVLPIPIPSPAFRDLESAFDRSALRIEEQREDDHLVVRAEMPGIDPDEDVEITVTDNTLHLSAERREENREEGDEGAYRSEFRYGRFTRSVPLPPGATEEDVEASYADGILEVRIPIAAESTGARRIPVSRG